MSACRSPAPHDGDKLLTKEELVVFDHVTPSYSLRDGLVTVKYSVGSQVYPTSGDWIGIFPSGCQNISRPLIFQWVSVLCLPHRANHQQRVVSFPIELVQSLQSPANSYQLMYIDSESQVRGVSRPFLTQEFTHRQHHSLTHSDLAARLLGGPGSPTAFNPGQQPDGRVTVTPVALSLEPYTENIDECIKSQVIGDAAAKMTSKSLIPRQPMNILRDEAHRGTPMPVRDKLCCRFDTSSTRQSHSPVPGEENRAFNTLLENKRLGDNRHRQKAIFKQTRGPIINDTSHPQEVMDTLTQLQKIINTSNQAQKVIDTSNHNQKVINTSNQAQKVIDTLNQVRKVVVTSAEDPKVIDTSNHIQEVIDISTPKLRLVHTSIQRPPGLERPDTDLQDTVTKALDSGCHTLSLGLEQQPKFVQAEKLQLLDQGVQKEQVIGNRTEAIKRTSQSLAALIGVKAHIGTEILPERHQHQLTLTRSTTRAAEQPAHLWYNHCWNVREHTEHIRECPQNMKQELSLTSHPEELSLDREPNNRSQPPQGSKRGHNTAPSQVHKSADQLEDNIRKPKLVYDVKNLYTSQEQHKQFQQQQHHQQKQQQHQHKQQQHQHMSCLENGDQDLQTQTQEPVAPRQLSPLVTIKPDWRILCEKMAAIKTRRRKYSAFDRMKLKKRNNKLIQAKPGSKITYRNDGVGCKVRYDIPTQDRQPGSPATGVSANDLFGRPCHFTGVGRQSKQTASTPDIGCTTAAINDSSCLSHGMQALDTQLSQNLPTASRPGPGRSCETSRETSCQDRPIDSKQGLCPSFLDRPAQSCTEGNSENTRLLTNAGSVACPWGSRPSLATATSTLPVTDSKLQKELHNSLTKELQNNPHDEIPQENWNGARRLEWCCQNSFGYTHSVKCPTGCSNHTIADTDAVWSQFEPRALQKSDMKPVNVSNVENPGSPQPIPSLCVAMPAEDSYCQRCRVDNRPPTDNSSAYLPWSHSSLARTWSDCGLVDLQEQANNLLQVPTVKQQLVEHTLGVSQWRPCIASNTCRNVPDTDSQQNELTIHDREIAHSDRVPGARCQDKMAGGADLQELLFENTRLRDKLELLEFEHLEAQFQSTESGRMTRIRPVGRKSQKAKSVRHRRLPLVKSSDDVKNTVRYEEVILYLRSRVKDSNLDIRELRQQVAALKQFLVVETRNTERACWKLAKLKRRMREYKEKVRKQRPPRPVNKRQKVSLLADLKDRGDLHQPAIKRPRTIPNGTDKVKDGGAAAEKCLLATPAARRRQFQMCPSTPAVRRRQLEVCPSSPDRLNPLLPGMALVSAPHALVGCHGDSYLSQVSNGFGFVSAFNPAHQTDHNRLSISSWSRCPADPEVTCCHQDMVTSNIGVVGLHSHTCRPYLQASLNTAHLDSGCSLHQLTRACPSAEYCPSLETAQSYVGRQDNLCSYPRPRTQRQPLYSELHEAFSSTALHSPGQHCKKCMPLCGSVPQPVRGTRTPQCSPLSCNNSRNKSREGSISDLQHISPLPSPSLLPIPTNYSNFSGRGHGWYPGAEVVDDIPVHVSRLSTTSLYRSRSGQAGTHSGDKEQSQNTLDSNLYWPSQPADQAKNYLDAFRVYKTAQSRGCHAAAQLPVNVAPVHVSQTQATKPVQQADKIFAYASGATVCPEGSSSAEKLSNSVCKWLTSTQHQAADSRSGLLGIFTSPRSVTQHVSSYPTNHARPLSVSLMPETNEHQETIYSHFQSCFLKHVAKDVLQQQPKLLAVQEHPSTTENREYNQHSQTPAQATLLYTYPRTPLSLPPSELPYPPLSPFHHASSTQMRKTDAQALAAQGLGHNSQNMLTGPGLLQNTLQGDCHSLVQDGSGIMHSLNGSRGHYFAIRRLLDSSGGCDNQGSMLDFRAQSLKHVLDHSAFLASGTLADSCNDDDSNKRQIEAHTACQLVKQE